MKQHQHKPTEEEKEDELSETINEIKGENDLDDVVHKMKKESDSENMQDADDRVHSGSIEKSAHSAMEDPDERVHQ